MSPASRASLVVLTGGRSSRMGRDKAQMDAGGVPLAARPIQALAGLCDDIVLAGRAVPGVAGRVAPDEPGTTGPVAGLVAGLRAAQRDLCVVVGCDMPSIEAEVVALLLDVLDRDGSTPAACCARAGGLVEPLPLAIRTATARALAGALAAGARALRDALAILPTALVDQREWSTLDPEGLTFESWNSPEDVRLL